MLRALLLTTCLLSVELAAAEGSAIQQHRLAQWFTYGTFKDKARAAYWMRKAAQADMADAQYLVGRLYAEGTGVARSFPAAAAWFTKASGQGHAEAAYALAHLYRHGKGVPRDSAAASRWNFIAAKRGHHNAIYDIAQEPHCLKEAVEMGIPLAQGMLGRWYENPDGDPQQPHDYTSAAGWYRRAAEAGDVRGIESLADLHARGLGVPEDPVIAKMLELIAASPRFGSSSSSRLRAR